jgi:DNA-directed RNA polymerase specialized sigma24 family protein
MSAAGRFVRMMGMMRQAAARWRDRNRPVALTSEDVERALRGLSDGDLLRLRALASLRARGLPGGIGWADLPQEAVLRALDGSRCWPAGVTFVAFLAGIVRSQADEYWRCSQREAKVVEAASGAADHGSDPEQACAAGQALAAIDRLFADDPTALKIIAGLADGLTAAEIRGHYAMSALEYATGWRRMRRAYYGAGWEASSDEFSPALGRLLDELEEELSGASDEDIEAALTEARRSRQAAVREARNVLRGIEQDEAGPESCVPPWLAADGVLPRRQ